MKKRNFVVLGLVLLLVSQHSFSADNTKLRAGITNYKSGNYMGCLQSMAAVIATDPNNALAQYYIGMANAKLGKKDAAAKAYMAVISLDSNPTLTAYARLGQVCVQNPEKCGYEETTQLDRDVKYIYSNGKFATPAAANNIRQIDLDVKRATFNAEMSMADKYDKPAANQPATPPAANQQSTPPAANKQTAPPPATTPAAAQVTTPAAQQQPAANPQKSDASTSSDSQKKNLTSADSSNEVSDADIANAVRTLAKAGMNPMQFTNMMNPYQNPQNLQIYQQSPEMAQISMMTGNGGNGSQNNFMSMMPYLMSLQHAKGDNQNINPEMIKTMMMSSMMGDMNAGLFMNDNNDNDNY